MAYYAAGCLKCRKDPAGDESHVRWGKYSMNYRIYLTAPQLQTPEALLQRRKGSEGEVREGEVLLWSGGAGPPKAGAAPHTVLCKHTGRMWYCLWGRRVRHPECISVSDELSSSPLDGEQPAVSILTWAVSFLPIEKPLPQASTHWLTVAFPPALRRDRLWAALAPWPLAAGAALHPDQPQVGRAFVFKGSSAFPVRHFLPRVLTEFCFIFSTVPAPGIVSVGMLPPQSCSGPLGTVPPGTQRPLQPVIGSHGTPGGG